MKHEIQVIRIPRYTYCYSLPARGYAQMGKWYDESFMQSWKSNSSFYQIAVTSQLGKLGFVKVNIQVAKGTESIIVTMFPIQGFGIVNTVQYIT